MWFEAGDLSHRQGETGTRPAPVQIGAGFERTV